MYHLQGASANLSVSYVMANVGYYAVLPIAVITSSETIALVLLFGKTRLTIGLWIYALWISRRNCLRIMRCSVMLWRSQCNYFHVCPVSLCCRSRTLSSIDVWRIASQADDTYQSSRFAGSFDLSDGHCG